MITFVQISPDNLRHNLTQVRDRLQPTSRLMAVVKANAYGHGLIETARIFAEAGADWLGVSTVEEGVALREAGIEAPTLVFLPPLPEQYEALVTHGLTATVVGTAEVSGLGSAAQQLGRRASCHVYVDSGLGRLGSDDPLAEVLAVAAVAPALDVTGIYTHFGPPGSGRMLEEIDSLREGASIKAFAGLARDIAAQTGLENPLVHAAASALFLEDAESHLDMVRIGTLLYGQYPDHVHDRPLDLREGTFSLRSRIIAIHTVPSGGRVGYGGEFICRRETKVATVPVGIAHGLGMAPQSASTRLRSAVKSWLIGREGRRGASGHSARAALGEHPAPIIGRISMDQCCLDVTDVPGAQVGDRVTLPVRRLAVPAAVPRIAASSEM